MLNIFYFIELFSCNCAVHKLTTCKISSLNYKPLHYSVKGNAFIMQRLVCGQPFSFLSYLAKFCEVNPLLLYNAYLYKDT